MNPKYGRHTAPAKRQPQTNYSDLSIVLLSAAPAKKMRAMGSRSLVQLKNTTLIEHQYNTLRAVFPSCEIWLVCGEDWNKVKEKSPKDIRVVINPIWDSTNSIFSLLLALTSILNKRVLVIYGDLLFDMDFIRQDLSKSAIFHHSDCQNDVGIIENNGKIESLGFGLPKKWSQIIYLAEKELEISKKIAYRNDIKKLLGHEFVNMIIDGGGNFVTINSAGKLLEIDSYKQLNQSMEFV